MKYIIMGLMGAFVISEIIWWVYPFENDDKSMQYFRMTIIFPVVILICLIGYWIYLVFIV